MRTVEKIWFSLLIEEPGQQDRTVIVCPRYSDLKERWSQPSDKIYHEHSYSGTVTFLGVDFDVLNGCSMRASFTLYINNRKDGTRGVISFMKSACKWDIDRKSVQLDISASDKHKELEDKSDEEYNLVNLGITRRQLSLYDYPVSQLAVNGDSKIVVYTNSGHVAPDITEIENLGDSIYNFGTLKAWVYINVPSGQGVLSGTYEGYFTFGSNEATPLPMVITNGTCTANFVGGQGNSGDLWRIDFFNGTTKVAQSANLSYGELISHGYTIVNRIGTPGQFTARVMVWKYGMRLLADTVPIGSLLSHKNVTVDDLYPCGKRYIFARSNESTGVLKISERTSPTDKGYGKVEGQDYYYDTPDDNEEWIALYQASWFSGVSLWARVVEISETDINQFKKEVAITDFYLLGDVIKAVIDEMNIGVTFEPDTDHSTFLFSSVNPVTNEQQGSLYITQKSNVLNLGYDHAAWLAPVKWSQIVTLLRNAFNCYFDIYTADGVNHLRIEHRSFYENSGSYSQASRGNIDLRALYNTGCRKPYAFMTNHWEWDTGGGVANSSASRYEYGWMDTQSEAFDGHAMEIPEDYLLFTDAKTEERKVDWFSSDIDFLTAVPAECSSDGFAIVMEDLSNSGWIVRGTEGYKGQNYNLALDYLQPRFLIAGLYSSRVSIGKDKTVVNNPICARMRKNTVDFSLPDYMTVRPTDSIVTSVGSGVIESIEHDLGNDTWTATLRYING